MQDVILMRHKHLPQVQAILFPSKIIKVIVKKKNSNNEEIHKVPSHVLAVPFISEQPGLDSSRPILLAELSTMREICSLNCLRWQPPATCGR